MNETLQLLDYIATQEEVVLTYNASDIKLAVHSDASYRGKPKARSTADEHFFEFELAALCIMAKEAVCMRVILEKLGTNNHQRHSNQTTRWQMRCSKATFN